MGPDKPSSQHRGVPMRLRIPIGLNADSDEGLNRPLVVTSTDSRTTIAAQQRHRQAGRDCFQLRTFLTNGLLPTDRSKRSVAPLLGHAQNLRGSRLLGLVCVEADTKPVSSHDRDRAAPPVRKAESEAVFPRSLETPLLWSAV